MLPDDVIESAARTVQVRIVISRLVYCFRTFLFTLNRGSIVAIEHAVNFVAVVSPLLQDG